ncbi:SAM-dependent methyltransferase, partial [Acinetobacter baumannii]
DINDFVGGMRALLAPQGTVTVECPHLLNLIAQAQFDTVYHEHFSYLSLVAVQRVMQSQGLRVYDVEELPTHGGSLRIYACHAD